MAINWVQPPHGTIRPRDFFSLLTVTITKSSLVEGNVKMIIQLGERQPELFWEYILKHPVLPESLTFRSHKRLHYYTNSIKEWDAALRHTFDLYQGKPLACVCMMYGYY